MRLKLIIAYDGSHFAGWQSQAHGRAVQDVIEAAMKKITGSRVVLHGSGRTDSGVHALGQCAHADVPGGSLTPQDWQRALNAGLPAAIRILSARRAPADFHARFAAKGKIYRYLIRNAPVLPPHEADRVWFVPGELDPSSLQAAGKIFVGRHDFAAFTANRGGKEKDTTRTIRRVAVSCRGSLTRLTFEGEGFLYRMVRMMVGAMVRAAQGREELESLRLRLEEGGPRWTHVAPAGGLYLARVFY
jgi:tRNA pseudouridine38-40 synthase